MKGIEEVLQAYLTGEMTDQERSAFEIALQNNKDLQKRVSIYQEIDKVLSDGDWDLTPANTTNATINSYREFFQGQDGIDSSMAIKNAESRYFDEIESSKNGSTKRWYGIAAVVTALIVSTLVFWRVNQEVSPVELYAYYHSDEDLPSFTNRDEDTTLSNIEYLYTSGDYQQALVLINSYSNDSSVHFDSRVYLYQGSILLKLNQDQEALKAFEKLLKSDSLDSFKSHWYLALVYLKMNNKDKALIELQALIGSDQNFKKQEALELIEKLD